MRPLKYSKTALAGSFLLLFSSVSAAILGIDLGQEYIKAALVKPGIPLEIVLTRDSKRKETAAIAFKPNTQATADSKDFNYPDRLYGSDALAVHPRFAADTYPNIKQLLGLTMDDKQLESYTARYPALQIVPSDVRTTVAFKSKSAPKTSGDDEDEEEGKWTVEELLAMQLKNVKKNAEAMAGSVIKDAVFAIPTAFNPEERNALMIAADLAGLRPMAMISDGLAVAINYATTRSFEPKDPPQTHVIYDMGAGSVSATVVRIGGIIVKELGQTRPVVDIAVQGVGVDKSLGGDLYTERLVDYLIDEFIKTPKGSTIAQSEDEARKKIKSDGKAMAKLWKEAGRVRHILSANTEAYASIEALVDDIDFRSNKVLRSTFEELIDETKERIVNPIRHALNVAGVELEKVKSVIIHGGSVRTPFVTKAIEELVGADKISKNVNPDEAAVLGATFHGASLSKSFRVKEMHVHDQTLYPVSIKLHAHARKNIPVFNANSEVGTPKFIPFKKTQDFEFYTVYTVPPPPGYFHAQDRFINFIKTKNVTASAEKLSEQWGCDKSEITTQFTLKLNPANGIAQVTEGWVECETQAFPDYVEPEEEEQKGGVVDGVKNFLGLNKKTGSASDTSSSSTGTATTTESSSTTSTTSSEKPKPTEGEIRLVRSIPIDFEVRKDGIPALPAEDLKEMKDRLAKFDKYDSDKASREEARNALESFVYKAQSLLDDPEYVLASTEEERKKLAEKLSHAADWIYDEGYTAALDVIKKMHKEIIELEGPITRRVKESARRPELIKNIREAISAGKKLIDSIANPPKPTDAKADAPAPVPAPKEDVEKLTKYYGEVETWLEDIIKKQDALKPHENPVLTGEAVEAKMKELNDKIMELVQSQLRAAAKVQEKLRKEKEEAKKKAKEAEKAASESAKTEGGSSTETNAEAEKKTAEPKKHDEL